MSPVHSTHDLLCTYSLDTLMAAILTSSLYEMVPLSYLILSNIEGIIELFSEFVQVAILNIREFALIFIVFDSSEHDPLRAFHNGSRLPSGPLNHLLTTIAHAV
jgi:hypothetical protein